VQSQKDLYNISMAEPIVWSELPKAQDDPQTIAEAIAAAIAAHEADPEAHLGEDESLEAHRANDVLDHPPGSTLADKWTMSELEFSTLFENLSVFGTTNSVYNLFPGVTVAATGTGSGGESALDVSLEDRSIALDFSKEFLIQFAFNADQYSGGKVQLNFGFTLSRLTKDGVGLELNNTNKRFYVTDVGGGSPAYLNWPGFTDLQNYVVRIHNVPDEGIINIYINGELLGTLTPPNASASDATHFIFSTGRSSGSTGVLNLISLFVSMTP